MLVMGIDLSSSNKRPSTYAFLNRSRKLEKIGVFLTNDELIELAKKHKPRLISIDSPLGLPKGLCCLEESCSCKPVLNPKGRIAELELAKMGIGCFFTSKRSIIKPMIYRAIDLVGHLRRHRLETIEVYPYATKVLLFGEKIPSKSSPEGLAFLKTKLLELVPGLDRNGTKLGHDECDAVLAAYTAAMYCDKQADLVGTADEGYIVVPKLH